MLVEMRALAVLTLSASLAACAGMPPEKRENLIDRNGLDIIGSPADRTHIAIKDPRSVERFCKGPGPDFSLTASEGVTLGTQAVGPIPAGGAVGTSSSRGAIDLGGRNPAVLLAREMFYRVCELTLNTNIDSKSAIALYKLTLDAVERIAAVQTGAGSIPASASPPPAMQGLPSIILNAPTTSAGGQAPAASTGTVDTEAQ